MKDINQLSKTPETKGDQYVYMYVDPNTHEPRYFGVGGYAMLYSITKPSRKANKSPFYKWVQEQGKVNWRNYRMRIFGPCSQVEAQFYANEMTKRYQETVLGGWGFDYQMKTGMKVEFWHKGVKMTSTILKSYQRTKKVLVKAWVANRRYEIVELDMKDCTLVEDECTTA